LRGGAVSDELGRVLSGTAAGSPVFASLPTNGTAWTTGSVAKITNDQNVSHDSMAFSHDSTKLFSNNYLASRNTVYTWNVGTARRGRTDPQAVDSTNIARRSLSAITSAARTGLLRRWYGRRARSAIRARNETVLLDGLTGGDITYVKVSGVGTAQSYLYVGAEASATNPSISVYKLAADGKSVTSTVPVASFAGAALMTDILGVAPNYNRAFEVTSDGQVGFFGTHAGVCVHRVSGRAGRNTTPGGPRLPPPPRILTFRHQPLSFSLVECARRARSTGDRRVHWTPSEAGPGLPSGCVSATGPRPTTVGDSPRDGSEAAGADGRAGRGDDPGAGGLHVRR
jgi:hypothetical protein